MDETDWLSFRKYAERVRCMQIWGHATCVPPLVKQSLTASLERCSGDRLLIFPKLTKFDWRETAYSSSDDSGIPLFKYIIGPAVTTIALSFIRLQVPSASEWAMLSDLPNLCPSVTSFTSFFSCPQPYDPSQQVGYMVTQWERLRSLRSCVIPQFNMNKLASQRTLETLGIEINISSPLHVDRIPDTVRELLLSPRDTSLCTRYLQNVHGSPTTCSLFIGMNHVEEAEIEALFLLLPLRLDTSCLKHLTIQPRSVFARTRLSELPKLSIPLIPPLCQFSQLRELDMDLFCASHLRDVEYARLAKSWAHLRHLKIGTAKLSSVIRPSPAASVAAVIAVVTYCPHLETLGIAFDGTIPPPPSLTRLALEAPQEWAGNDERPSTVTAAESGDLVPEGWGVPNTCIAKLHVGYSPIANATLGILMSCLKSLMPCLKEIKHHGLDKRWCIVQKVLTNS